MNRLNYILYLGVRSMEKPLERNIVLCNAASIILVVVSLVFGLIHTLFYGFIFTSWFVFISAFFFLVPILMNATELTSASRLVLSLIFPVFTTLASLTTKNVSPTLIEETGYYDYRFILLISGVFPLIFINLKERKLLTLSLLAGFLCIALFDPIHNYFGIGYHQKVSHGDPTYYFTNVVVLLCYILLLATIISLRLYFEKFEHENIALVKLLNDNNKVLAEKNDEISVQHEELVAQNEEIISQHEQLSALAEEVQYRNNELNEAKATIQKQNKILEVENQELTSELVEKSQHLEQTNHELIKHNNELQQFSYAVSHNLRGPVASLLGLINIFKKEELSVGNKQVFDFMNTSVHNLDQVITDLSKIVDIRHSIFQIRQRISLMDEIDQIKQHLQKEIKNNNIGIHPDLEKCPEIFSVRPLIHSILYNLISNAVKYRNQARDPFIEIISSQDDTHYFLRIHDNGLGIDLKKYKNSLFKLYKRFHLQSEGKGLGLYLVKLQVESLGGTIGVISEVNQFTEFSISIKKPINLSKQIIFEEAYAKFFFNAYYDTCGLVWSGTISSEQYRTTMTRCLELLQVYNTPNWISDAMERGAVSTEDLDWVIKDIVTPAAKIGLKRVCFIRKDANEPGTVAFVEGLRKKLPTHKIELGVFTDFQLALNWVQEKNLTD